MSLRDNARLQFPWDRHDETQPPPAVHHRPAPYLGAVGTIPLSVSPDQIPHHPGRRPAPEKTPEQ